MQEERRRGPPPRPCLSAESLRGAFRQQTVARVTRRRRRWPRGSLRSQTQNGRAGLVTSVDDTGIPSSASGSGTAAAATAEPLRHQAEPLPYVRSEVTSGPPGRSLEWAGRCAEALGGGVDLDPPPRRRGDQTSGGAAVTSAWGTAWPPSQHIRVTSEDPEAERELGSRWPSGPDLPLWRPRNQPGCLRRRRDPGRAREPSGPPAVAGRESRSRKARRQDTVSWDRLTAVAPVPSSPAPEARGRPDGRG